MASENNWPVRGGSGGGSPYYIDPVSSVISLPPTAPEGTLALVKDVDALYEYRSGAWVLFIDPSVVADNQTATQTDLNTHKSNTNNPHSVTKAQVGLGNVDNTSDVNKPVSTAQAAADALVASDAAAATALKINLTEKGAANGVATLDAGGQIPSSQLPPVAITETFVVASQAAQTALTAQIGDVAVRSDLSRTFILRAEPASVFANWSEMMTPTDSVISVNGYSGSVSLTKADLALGNVDNTSDATKNAAAVTLTNKTLDEPIIVGEVTPPAYAEGKMWYDSTNKSMRYYNNSQNIAASVDQSTLIRVYNNTAAPMTKGQVVSFAGSTTGTIPNVVLSAGGLASGDRTCGILGEDIAIGTSGFAVALGVIENLNTSAFTAGAQLYPSSSTAGQLQTAIPAFAKKVGSVIVSNATTGSIFVQIDNQAIPGPGANSQILSSSGAAPAWKNVVTGAVSGNNIDGASFALGLNVPYVPNYIVNGDFESSSGGVLPTGWAQYNDGAVAIPVDGTGGTAVGTVTFLTSTTSPVRGTRSVILTKDAVNRQGVGYSYAFTLGRADRSKKMQIQCEVEVDTGTYAAGDLAWYIYDVTNATIITPSTAPIPGGSASKWVVTFDTTQSTSYRLCLHVATTSALAYTVKFDLISVDSGIQSQGAAIGEWESTTSYTIAANTTNPTPGAGATFYRRTTREGSYARIRWEYKQSVAGAAGSGPYRLPLPTGLNLDLARLPGATGSAINAIVPTTGMLNTTGGIYNVQMYYGTTGGTGALFGYLGNDTTSPANGWSGVLGNLGQALVEFAIEVVVPIAEWAGSGTVNLGAGAQPSYASNSSTSTATDTTSFQYGEQGALIQAFAPAGQVAVTKRVRSPYPNPRFAILQVKDSNLNWIDVGSYGNYGFSLSGTGVGAIAYGVGMTPVSGSATDFDVNFFSLVNAGGTPWSTVSSAGSRWRVVFADTPAAVGFGLASATDSGLITATTQTIGGAKTFNNGVASGAGNDVILRKVYAGVTNAAQGGLTTISHGLDASKIRSISGLVFDTGASGVCPAFTANPGYEYHLSFGSVSIALTNKTGNSGSILSKNFVVLVDYIP